MNVTSSALQSAMLGLQRGQQQVNRAAADLAGASAANGRAEPTDTVRAVVGLRMGELQFEASAKTLKVQHDMLGVLLDTKA